MLANSRNWGEGCTYIPPTHILQVYAHTQVCTILNVTTDILNVTILNVKLQD